MTEPPLFREFLKLRRHRLPLAISDYLTFLEALGKGYGTHSRKSLLFTCSTLWAKSRDEQRLIEHLLNGMLPSELDLSDAGETLEEERNASSTLEGNIGSTQQKDAPPTRRRLRDRLKSLFGLDQSEDGSPQKDETQVVALPQVSATEDKLHDIVIELASAGKPPSWQSEKDFELIQHLPVPDRQMRRVWRGYRRSGRSGPKVELDVEAAIEQLSRFGVLLDLPMRAQRLNQAGLLLLVDQGGSMTPFRYATKALIEAVRSARFARLDVRYFHDVPRESIYKDALLREAQPLDEAAAAFVDKGVLIYSDAGAARGNIDEERVEASAEAIKILLSVTPTVVWLNPVPQRRWQGSSAGRILESADLPMYPFNTTGLRSAVTALHGRNT